LATLLEMSEPPSRPSPPRNRSAAEASQTVRAAIRAELERHTQAEPILTAKAILRLLEWPDERLCTVRRHLRAIRGPE
jgi:hypothetical protein